MQQLKDEGADPPALKNRPHLRQDLQLYWEAFSILSGSRPSGMGIGAIPFSEIKAYLDVFPDSDQATLIRLIQAQDKVYIKYHGDKR